MTDEGIEWSSMGPRCSLTFEIATERQSAKRLRHVSYVRSHLAPLDPHPALRATFPREGGRGPTPPARGKGSDNPLLLIARLEGGAQDVAERSARIG
jgi:hypothetical protein